MVNIKEYKLEEVYIGNLILQMIDFKLTGWIELNLINNVNKKIYIKAGEFIYANSTDNNDKIGMVLVNAGKITFKQLLNALQWQEKEKKMLGTIMIELSYIKISDLEWALYQQSKQIIMSAFQYNSGLARFYYSEIPSNLLCLKLDTEQIIIDGLKKINNIDILIKALGDMNMLVELNIFPQKIQKLELDNNDLNFLKQISNKKLSLKEICSMHGATKLDICKLIYLLMAIGCLKFAD